MVYGTPVSNTNQRHNDPGVYVLKKILTGAAALALGAVVLTGCSSVSTAPDQVALHYSGGPFSSTEFKDCVSTSTKAWDGPGDAHFVYPAGQRTYDFKGDGSGGADSPALAVVAGGTGEKGKDTQVELRQEGTLTFTFSTTDCESLRSFHEKIGLKYGADKAGLKQLNELLDVYLGGPLQRALSEATQGVDWKTYYSDATVRNEVEKRATELLPGYVQELSGGEFFSNFSVQLQRPTLPAELSDALKATQVAIEQNTAQQQRNVQVQSELESIRELVEVLGPDGYNTYQAINLGRGGADFARRVCRRARDAALVAAPG
jgi:hypothetical protein